ncbi:MAG: D-2-hydroxyacid dehydrogenase [Clostridia bacterium]|nr:D-2-hydroxyacid dehydrogenase [Clostridia bacterium]
MKIAVLDRCTVTNGDVSLDEIKTLGDVKFYDVVPPCDIPAAIGDADAVICNKAKITDEIMEKCKNLRYIGLFATGYNNIDTAAASRRGIAVCNVPGYSTDSVAQQVFAMILHFATSADMYSASVARGDWTKSKTFSYFAYPLTELAGKTLGIFGFGTIGKKVAEIGMAFGMKIIAVAHKPTSYTNVEFVNTNVLFARSDYLTLHCPLTDETRGVVNADTLALMKKSAVLINTARGGCVDERALVDALNGGMIAGAGIDVLDTEPMTAGHPYLSAKNIFITPHVAWGSYEARVRLIGLVCDNVRAFTQGKPINVVS